MTGQPRPRLGVLDFNPIQYHAPLYQRLAQRGNVRLSVLYLHDRGYRPVVDPDFGVAIEWDIDLLSGYQHAFLATTGAAAPVPRQAAALTRWIRAQDVVVIHGHSHPWMLAATLICRASRVPYLLRGDARPLGGAVGWRRVLRDTVARAVVSASAGGLAVGQLNEQFYRRFGARRVIFAPHSVDDERFAADPPDGRTKLLAQWGLDGSRPVVMFCGKLGPRKRPLDLAAAARLLGPEVSVLFVGDGELAGQVRDALLPGCGAVTGFVHQSQLPSFYHAADVLVLPSEAEPWGLVINEAMAAGTLPVASDRVGAARDLVAGVGEVYPGGDVPALAAALRRALIRSSDPRTRDRVREHASRYSLGRTVDGFETAARAAASRRP